MLRLLSSARSQESIPYFQLGWNNLLKVSSSRCSYHLAPKMSALLAAATHSACELCMHYLSPLHRVLCFMRETSPIYQHPLYPSTAWRSTCCYSNYSQATALSLLQITGRRDVDWLNLRLKQTNTLSRHFLPTAFLLSDLPTSEGEWKKTSLRNGLRVAFQNSVNWGTRRLARSPPRCRA